MKFHSNPGLCNARSVLYQLQLSYQANWELVIMWVNEKPGEGGYMHQINEFQLNCGWKQF